MNYDEILRKILRKYGDAANNSRVMQEIQRKLVKRTATYADANKYAQEIGRILTDVLREYLPEALTDGMLYRSAGALLAGPMQTAGKDVGNVAAEIQKQLNENAGIGLNAVRPNLNQDQIDGIITGICNASSYEGSVERLMDQVAGFLEGHVDDFVRENADFQDRSGLTVMVQRIADAKCCSWCNSLAGTYPYEDVRDKGNDVWKRHNNCHCQILFDPTGARRRRGR